jgi:hypothetical protein
VSVLGSNTAYVGLAAGTQSSSEGQSFSNFQFTTGAVPEPSTLALLVSIAAAVMMPVWRNRRLLRRSERVRESVSPSGPV